MSLNRTMRSTIYALAENETFNDGTVGSQPDWLWKTLSLPPLIDDDDQRVLLRAGGNPDKSAWGIDAVRITTNERCSPR